MEKLTNLCKEINELDVEQVQSPRHTITVDDFSFRGRLKELSKAI